MPRMFFVLMMLLATLSLNTACATASVKLTHNAKPTAAILIATDATEIELAAAQDLQLHLEKISGAKLEIKQVDTVAAAALSDNDSLIVLGSLVTDPAIAAATRKASSEPGAFTLSAKGNRIDILGNADEGTRIGVYELLEQLGVRWFHPGELGTVIPHIDSITIKDQLTTQAPSFAARYATPTDATWQVHNRMGGAFFVPAHGIPGFKGARGRVKKTFDEHPECFALNKATNKRHMGQACLSNPLTLKIAADDIRALMKRQPDRTLIGIGPNDGGGFCQCDDCVALDGGDWDAFSNEPSHTDRYWWFYNQLIAEVGDEFPNLNLQTYIYHTYIRPPVHVKPDPRVNGALAPITFCRVHGPGNPICPEARYYAWLIQEWSKISPKLFDRGYWFNLADPGLPFQMVSRIRTQIPLAHKMGIYGWRVEALGHWASENPSLWIAGKLMWDVDANVDELLADFHKTYYGPASSPMSQYSRLMDQALYNSDHHTGSSFDAPLHYTPAIRKEARTFLTQAAKLAGDDDSAYAQRVTLTRKTLDYLDAFIEMLDTRNAHDYVASKNALERVDAIQTDLLTGYDVPMLNARAATSYLKRFFRMPTEQAYERVTSGNTFVAGLDDQWQFMLDPNGAGESIGFESPNVTGGNWMNLLTSSSSWGNQGLRYYKGEAWYRQSVVIPESFKGKRIFLWIGGVDEKAKVFVNGKEIGISGGGSFVPFEVDATDAIIPGKPNLVAVRIVNNQVDELGTGGITAPVMFYAPAAGKDAELKNVRVLGRTFP